MVLFQSLPNAKRRSSNTLNSPPPLPFGQASINEIRDKYMEEHKAIEKKYEALYEPYFAKV